MAGKKTTKVKKNKLDDDTEQDVDAKKLKTEQDAVDVKNGAAPDESAADTEDQHSDNGAGDTPLDGLKQEDNGAATITEEKAGDKPNDVAVDDSAGRLIIFGGTNWDMTGRKERT